MTTTAGAMPTTIRVVQLQWWSKTRGVQDNAHVEERRRALAALR
jgi:hypothetical protein